MNESGEKILAVAVVVLNAQGDKILLHRREKEPDKDSWEIIGSYVRPGERLEDAVRRKIKSETGIETCESIQFMGKYYDDPQRHPGSYCIPLLFSSVVDERHPLLADVAWHDISGVFELPLALDNRQMILDARAAG